MMQETQARLAGDHHLPAISNTGRPDQLEPTCPVGSNSHCHAWCSVLLHIFDDYRLPAEDTRSRDGNRSDIDHAAVLRQQRHLSYSDHAWLAASYRPHQSIDL